MIETEIDNLLELYLDDEITEEQINAALGNSDFHNNDEIDLGFLQENGK